MTHNQEEYWRTQEYEDSWIGTEDDQNSFWEMTQVYAVEGDVQGVQVGGRIDNPDPGPVEEGVRNQEDGGNGPRELMDDV